MPDNELKKVRLGKSGIEVTELCFGALTLGRLQANITPEEGAHGIRRAVELGVSFIDTGQSYGTYEHIRLALEGLPNRDQIVIASKSHAKTYEEMEAAVDEILDTLNRETVDVMSLHLIKSVDDLRSREEAFQCLRDLQDKGVIHAIGISTHTVEGLRCALGNEDIEVVMPAVNRKGLGIIDGSLEDMLAVLRALRQEGKGTYAMKPLGGGHLLGDAEAAINYVRALPEVDCLAVGMKSLPEVEMNVRIFKNQDIPDSLRSEIGDVSRKLNIYSWCEACGQCVEKCDQDALRIEDSQAVVDQEKCILCGYCADACPTFAIRVI